MFWLLARKKILSMGILIILWLVPNRKRSASRLYIVTLLINFYAKYIMQNAGPDKVQAGIKIAGRNINNLRYADDTTLRAESQEELKASWWRWVKNEKAGLKLNVQKTKIMASSPITSWQIDGETVETMSDFIFSGFKITADGSCTHEVKRRLLLGRKAMTNLDSILKSRDITLPDKGQCSQSYGFSVTLLLIIANTLFKQHKRRLYTWTSPDSQYWNQIYYILCS